MKRVLSAGVMKRLSANSNSHGDDDESIRSLKDCFIKLYFSVPRIVLWERRLKIQIVVSRER